MRFLRVLRLGLVEPRLWRQRLGAELLRDHLADFGQRVLRQIDRVGTHVGDQANRIAYEIDAFIKLLRGAHRWARGQAELASGERRSAEKGTGGSVSVDVGGGR